MRRFFFGIIIGVFVTVLLEVVLTMIISCAPTIDYIKSGDPCRADSCEVVK